MARRYRDDIVEALHSDRGHQVQDRTASLIKQRFFWPGIDSFVAERVRQSVLEMHHEKVKSWHQC